MPWQRDIHWARDLYGVLETAGQTPWPARLAALNSAFATGRRGDPGDRQGGKTRQPDSTCHRSETSDAILHHVVRVEEGAELDHPRERACRRALQQVHGDQRGRPCHRPSCPRAGPDHERYRAATHMFARLGEESRPTNPSP